VAQDNYTFLEIRHLVDADLRALEMESSGVFDKLVLPSIVSGRLHMQERTLFGYVLVAFSQIDNLSKAWWVWSDRISQTARMEAFMRRFLRYQPLAIRLCIEIWRHGLTHTGNPQEFVDRSSGTQYQWTVDWGRELDPEMGLYLRAQENRDPYISLSILPFVRNLRRGAHDLFLEVGKDLETSELFADRWNQSLVAAKYINS